MISISQTTKGTLPRVPFVRMKNAVLGPRYDLSLVFVGNDRSRRWNRIYRGKDKPTNILAFPLSGSKGEIVIDLRQAKKDMKKFERTYHNFIGFLFIHGLFHLAGLQHGSTMELREKKVRRSFGI